MNTPLTLIRTIGSRDAASYQKTASLVASAAPGWMADAAALVAPANSSGAPFLHTDYDTALGYGCDAWHHGSATTIAYYGQVEQLEPYLDLTENERESLILATRKEIAAKHQVLCLAHHDVTLPKNTPPPLRPEPSSLQFDGAIVVQYTQPLMV